jgi:cytochrome c553
MLLSLAAAADEADINNSKYDNVRDKLRTCTTCHGDKGRSSNPAYPILAGQEMYYMYLQLQDFQADRRGNPQMEGLLTDLSRDQLRTMAEYFAAQSWPDIDFKTSKDMVRQGRKAASAGECTQCHLGGYTGNSRIPRLAGQHHQYLQSTMMDYMQGKRTNAPAMASLMETFSEEDIKALAAYLGQLEGD